MGQCESKERDFKEKKTDFRSKVLKNKRSKVKEEINREKKQRGCRASPSERPTRLTPTFCMSVFYRLSFLHLQSPPVRSAGTRSMRHMDAEYRFRVEVERLETFTGLSLSARHWGQNSK
jgi:hypothetical protein